MNYVTKSVCMCVCVSMYVCLNVLVQGNIFGPDNPKSKLIMGFQIKYSIISNRETIIGRYRLADFYIFH